MTYLEFWNILKKNDYKLQKEEAFMYGPLERQINNVFITFNDKEKKIFLKSSQINKLLLAEILNVILCDRSWENLELIIINSKINNIEVFDRDHEILIEKVLANKDNFLNIELTAREDVYYYEKSCCIYKKVPGYPGDYFLEKELKNWEDVE